MNVKPTLGMNKSPFPGTSKDIEAIALQLLGDMEEGEEQRASSIPALHKLIRKTGGEIESIEDPSLQELEGGSLSIRGDNDYTIYLSPYTTPLRDNFTIAHELGHYVLHYHLADNKQTPVSFTRYGSSPIEWQANRFAAAFLMPEEKFRELYELHKGNVPLLSGLFSVSLSAVQARKESLRM